MRSFMKGRFDLHNPFWTQHPHTLRPKGDLKMAFGIYSNPGNYLWPLTIQGHPSQQSSDSNSTNNTAVCLYQGFWSKLLCLWILIVQVKMLAVSALCDRVVMCICMRVQYVCACMSHWLLEHLQMVSFGLAAECQRLLSSSLLCIWCVCVSVCTACLSCRDATDRILIIVHNWHTHSSFLHADSHLSAIIPQSQPTQIVNGITRTFRVELIIWHQ